MNTKKTTAALFLILVLGLLGFAMFRENKKPVEPYEKSSFLLNTVISIKTFENDENAIKSVELAFSRIQEIEDSLSAYIDSSEISMINQNAGIGPVEVSDETYDIVKKSLKYSDLSDGFFDISIGPLIKLWDINGEHPVVPEDEDVKSLLPLVSFKDVELDDDARTVFLKEEGMSIDLGGIAKGYAADEAQRVLRKNNIKSAILNLGGNVYVLGAKPDSSKFKLGVQDPFSNRGEYFGILSLEDGSLVTSGIYERFFEKEGRRYHHILNPFDGYPMNNEIASVTIVSDKSIDGDALSTSVFCMGKDKGLELIESLDDIECIVVYRDRSVFISSGLKDGFKIEDESFNLMN